MQTRWLKWILGQDADEAENEGRRIIAIREGVHTLRLVWADEPVGE